MGHGVSARMVEVGQGVSARMVEVRQGCGSVTEVSVRGVCARHEHNTHTPGAVEVLVGGEIPRHQLDLVN